MKSAGLLVAALPAFKALGDTPPPDSYVVQQGDTLDRIARRHGLTAAELRRLNFLSNDLIRPGQKLRLRPPAKPEFEHLGGLEQQILVSQLDARKWKHIIIHHSGTPNGSAAIFENYHRRTRNMENGLAYHFVIGNGTDTPVGRVEVGSRWTRQIKGGHVRSEAFNENSIGICLVGNFEDAPPPTRQTAALFELVGFLRERALGTQPKILLHRQLEMTLCPGRHFPAERLKQAFS